jgi:twitching motility protein PilT
MVRQVLAGVLRGVISQRLLPKVDGGRVAAVEVMVNTARIADLVREGRTDEITEAIEDGDFHHMQSFSQHLVQLVLDGLVEEEVAANAASNRHDFEIAVQQALRRKKVADEAAAQAEAAAAEEAAEEAQPEEEENEVRLRLASSDQ